MQRTPSHLTVKVGPYSVLPGGIGVSSVSSSSKNSISLKSKPVKPSARQSMNFHSLSTAHASAKSGKRKLSRSPTPPPLSSRSHYTPRMQLAAGNNSLTPHSIQGQCELKPPPCSSRSFADSERQPSPLMRKDLKYFVHMVHRKSSIQDSLSSAKQRGSVFKGDKKFPRRNEKSGFAEAQNLEKELALRSGRIIKEEKREQRTTPQRKSSYTSISGVRKEYEETIRRIRMENILLKEELEQWKGKYKIKDQNEKLLEEQLQKSNKQLKDLKEIMEQWFEELKNPVFQRYRGLRELKRKIAQLVPQNREPQKDITTNLKSVETGQKKARKEITTESKNLNTSYNSERRAEGENSLDLFSFDYRNGNQKEQLQQLATINQEQRIKVESGSSSLMSTLKVITDQLNQAIQGETKYKSAFPSLSIGEDDYVESLSVQPLTCPQNKGTPKFKSFLSNCPF